MARSFSGSDKITVADNSTVEVTPPYSLGIFLRYTTAGNTVVFEKDGNNGLTLQTAGAGQPAGTLVLIGSGGGPSNRIDTGSAWNDGAWHGFCFVASVLGVNAANKVFVDGADDTDNSGGPTHSYGSGALYVGSRNGSFSFGGTAARCVLWDRALSDGEAAAFSLGASPVATGPVFWLELWGLASTEPDLSGNGNHGTVTGASAAAHAPVGRYVPMPSIAFKALATVPQAIKRAILTVTDRTAHHVAITDRTAHDVLITDRTAHHLKITES